MKTKLTSILLALFALTLIGCDDDDDAILVDSDPVPATPQGVFSVTGDEAVYVYFNGIYERDVDEYLVYRSLNATTGYTAIGAVDAVSNPDLDLIIYEYVDSDVTNGVTYYYAISAVDRAGQVSALSAEDVFDTPRPEGQATIFPMEIDTSLAGFNLATGTVVTLNSAAADVWIDSDTIRDISYLNVGNDLIDIQDMGFTGSFDDIGWAPTDGWSELGWVEIVVGHTYVIWTEDENFAKMRAVSENGSGSITFQWAFQTVVGNPELAPAQPKSTDRPEDYLKPRPGATLMSDLGSNAR